MAVVQPYAWAGGVVGLLNGRLMVVAKIACGDVAHQFHERRGAALLLGGEVGLGAIACGAAGAVAPETDRLRARLHFAFYQRREADAVQRSLRQLHAGPRAQGGQHVAGDAIHLADAALLYFRRPLNEPGHADAALVHVSFLLAERRHHPAVAGRAAIVAAVPQHRILA